MDAAFPAFQKELGLVPNFVSVMCAPMNKTVSGWGVSTHGSPWVAMGVFAGLKFFVQERIRTKYDSERIGWFH